MNILNKISIIFVVSVICSVLQCDAQALKILKQPELQPTNIYAAHNSRKSSKGESCAVLFLKSTITGLKFEGKVVGDVEQGNAVYIIYLEPGSSVLNIEGSKGEQLKLKLKNLSPKSTYEAVLGRTESVGFLKCTTTPSGAQVSLVYGTESIYLGISPIQGNVEIREGVYDILINKPGYRTEHIKNVKIKPTKTTTINVTLK